MYRDFTEMPVWKKAMDIAVDCFFFLKGFKEKKTTA